MFPDFVTETISNSWCKDCQHSIEYHWQNGLWCFGQIRKNRNYPRCDVIRFCNKTPSKYHVQMDDYAPDEALILSSMLSKLTGIWLWRNDSYRKFKTKGYNYE